MFFSLVWRAIAPGFLFVAKVLTKANAAQPLRIPYRLPNRRGKPRKYFVIILLTSYYIVYKLIVSSITVENRWKMGLPASLRALALAAQRQIKQGRGTTCQTLIDVLSSAPLQWGA
jgi:hypothetical protein